ncbi:SOS response-associated peptidase [Thermostichus sp. MS-CIW-15]
MCGRFSLAVAPERLQQHFPIERGAVGALQPRDNIAPSQPVLAVVAGSLQRQAVHFRWGLIPRWSQAPQAGWINARAETVAEKPSFRQAFCRRLLIPADGFYEWVGRGKQGRQPYWFYLVERLLTLPPRGFLRSPQKNP